MSTRISAVGTVTLKDLGKLPNLITLGRLLLLPVIFFCLRQEGLIYPLAAVVMILAAILLDALDGYIAHRFNQVTSLGRILDPVVDKISVGCGIIFLLILREFPLWAALIILGRDVAILALVFILIRRKNLIATSNLLGKATVLALGGMILFHIVRLQPYATIFTYVGVALVILSGLDYIVGYLRIIRNTHEEHAQ